MSARTKETVITVADLGHSKKACYRIEDAIWARLRALRCSERSSAADIRLALVSIRQQCPEWCEQGAWEAIAGSFTRWASTFGGLREFVFLRRKRDE